MHYDLQLGEIEENAESILPNVFEFNTLQKARKGANAAR